MAKERPRCMFYGKSKTSFNGFAIAEIVIALAMVSMAALIVGGLGQQVLNLAKSSRQTAASIELRTKTNSISRNLDSWLAKMRSSINTQGLYAACLPDNSAVSSIFNCPAVDDSLFDANSELKRIAGEQLHVSAAPLVDLLGEKLAGTIEEPLYLDLDGRNCTHPNPSQTCPLKSTGFFLRSNPANDSTPGSIRFVVKLEQNRNAPVSKGSSPLRTQYLSIDVGSEWQQSEAFCPKGSLKLGYLGNGQPNCVNPTAKKCDAGTLYLGLDNSSNPICQAPPSTCTTGGVIIDTASNSLVCSSSTPCVGQGEIFMGYYSGTGSPICSKLNVSCPDGQVQVGLENTTAGAPAALCKQLPSCDDSQKLSYDGSQFVCQSASVASTCAEGEVVVGINTDGSAQCQAAERGLSSTNLDCAPGEVMTGLRSDGSVKCKALAVASATPGTVSQNTLFASVAKSTATSLPCAQSGGAWTQTRIVFDVSLDDTAGVYSTATGRFTPPSGVWNVSASMYAYDTQGSNQHLALVIYKNGTPFLFGPAFRNSSANTGASISALLRANGTDYFEIYADYGNCQQNANIAAGQKGNWAQFARVGDFTTAGTATSATPSAPTSGLTPGSTSCGPENRGVTMYSYDLNAKTRYCCYIGGGADSYGPYAAFSRVPCLPY
ncbi:MAG: hypothetical protein R3A80_02335 [Bdellovibrionota bacterium]